MEPLTVGAIAFLTYFGNKLIDWGVGKAYDAAFAEVMQKLAPETIATLQAGAQTLSLPDSNRENIGVAVLVSEVEKATQANPEFKAAVEALGTEAQKNSQLENAVKELTEALKNQPQNTQNIGKVANTVEKVGVANVNSTIGTQNITQTF
jgi:predicted O-linked N-acetylglucosamine transferase (SPINDLY family)